MVKAQKLQAFPKRPSTLKTKVYLTNSQKNLPLSLPCIRKGILFLLANLKISTNAVHFYFVTDTRLRALHKEFFNDPSSTDCITFPLDSPSEIKCGSVLGEAFICPKIAIRYAKKYKIDPLEELYRYIVHCLLHMIGYDDQSPKERAKMRKKETICLKKLAENGFLKN